MIDLFATTTTSNTVGNTIEAMFHPSLYVHIETKPEYFTRRADQSADEALHWGILGRVRTAEILAEMADLFAGLADHARLVESLS